MGFWYYSKPPKMQKFSKNKNLLFANRMDLPLLEKIYITSLFRTMNQFSDVKIPNSCEVLVVLVVLQVVIKLSLRGPAVHLTDMKCVSFSPHYSEF